jgi:hypothetical protein
MQKEKEVAVDRLKVQDSVGTDEFQVFILPAARRWLEWPHRSGLLRRDMAAAMASLRISEMFGSPFSFSPKPQPV